MQTVKNLLLVANLYPTESKPYFGTFVKRVFEQLDEKYFYKTLSVLPHYGNGPLGYIKFYAKTFQKALSHRGIIYVHYVSHSMPPILLAQLISSKFKIVINYHGSDAFPEKNENWLKSNIKELICKYSNSIATKIIVPSEYFKEKVKEKFNIDDNKIFISPSGGYDGKVFFEKNIGPRKVKTYIFASRMVPGKGAKIAAQSAIEIAKKNENVNFIFIGNGPEKERVETLLAPLIEANKCKMFNALNQNELSKAFQSADFFLFPSHREGESLGLVLVESIACGAIPLVVNQGAIGEIIGNETRLMCNDTSDYINLVENSLLISDEEENLIKDNLRKRIEKYRSENVSTDLNKFFKEITNE